MNKLSVYIVAILCLDVVTCFASDQESHKLTSQPADRNSWLQLKFSTDQEAATVIGCKIEELNTRLVENFRNKQKEKLDKNCLQIKKYTGSEITCDDDVRFFLENSNDLEKKDRVWALFIERGSIKENLYRTKNWRGQWNHSSLEPTKTKTPKFSKRPVKETTAVSKPVMSNDIQNLHNAFGFTFCSIYELFDALDQSNNMYQYFTARNEIEKIALLNDISGQEARRVLQIHDNRINVIFPQINQATSNTDKLCSNADNPRLKDARREKKSVKNLHDWRNSYRLLKNGSAHAN